MNPKAPPDRETCLEILKRRGVPEHIILHSLQVERVARLLTQALNQRGEALDLGVVEAASLLHDIAKMDGLKTGQNHAEAGAKILEEMGYPRVARVVRYHIVPPEGEDLLVKVTEEEVVNYADKRVMHDRVVTLEERFADLCRRYGRDDHSRALIAAALERARQIERKIFQKIPMKPEALSFYLQSRPRLS
jgi:putative nucleotidyltransferase with HDIG domain